MSPPAPTDDDGPPFNDGPVESQGFGALGISASLIEVLAKDDLSVPTEIQEAVIPDMLAGRDVLAQAPTGSGKTLAFGLPVMMTLGAGEPKRPRGLVLAPTRELVAQIRRDLRPLAAALGRDVLAIYGGVEMRPQISALRKGTDLVIATPGRLQDLIDKGELTLASVDWVVVDEADRMADMGFLPNVKTLLDLTHPERQTVLFSATLDDAVEALTDAYQRDPVQHSVGGSEPDITLMQHRFIRTTAGQKVPLAAQLIQASGSTMLFCRTRRGVDRVYRDLQRTGVSAGWIHGGRTQQQRDAALMAFADGRVSVLVATDVAARGLHVDDVACVIHYDPPADAKDYVHRSGRTARAGASGLVVSVINREQGSSTQVMRAELGLPLQDIEAYPEQPESLTAERSQGSEQSVPKPDQPKAKKPKKPVGKSRTGKARPKNRKKSGQTTPQRVRKKARRGSGRTKRRK